MNFDCPHCGQNIEADESLGGTAAQCPTCSGSIIVPFADVAEFPKAAENKKCKKVPDIPLPEPILKDPNWIEFKCFHCKAMVQAGQFDGGSMMTRCRSCGRSLVVPRDVPVREGESGRGKGKEAGEQFGSAADAPSAVIEPSTTVPAMVPLEPVDKAEGNKEPGAVVVSIARFAWAHWGFAVPILTILAWWVLVGVIKVGFVNALVGCCLICGGIAAWRMRSGITPKRLLAIYVAWIFLNAGLLVWQSAWWSELGRNARDVTRIRSSVFYPFVSSDDFRSDSSGIFFDRIEFYDFAEFFAYGVVPAIGWLVYRLWRSGKPAS